jgi:hypothetical protein
MRLVGSRPDHLQQHRPSIITARYFAWEGHAPTMDAATGLQPEVEPEAIDRGHRGLVGVLAGEMLGDQSERFGVVGIHVLDDSNGGIHQRVRPALIDAVRWLDG